MARQDPGAPGTRRTALITGAAQGLGAAVAARLHAAGHRVVLADLDLDGATRTAGDLDSDGATAVPWHVDVADPAAIEAAGREVAERVGAVDILINNAGRTVPRSIWDIDVAEWDDILATNLRSVLLVTRAFAPAMRARGWGRIVNMASIAGQQGGLVAGAHYASSKAGIIVLTKIFAKDLAADGVTVNAVAPAAVRTPAMDQMDPEKLAASRATIPVGRFGEAAEVAAMVAYLCQEDAGYVTGATLDINGGVAMR